MKVTLIEPYGFCMGVQKAIDAVLNVKKQTDFKNYYTYGPIVHNDNVNLLLSNCGVKTLDATLDALSVVTKDDCVFFTAHGHTKEAEEYLIDKGVIYFDCICPIVGKNKEFMAYSGTEIIYVGSSTHPETIAALSYNKDAVFFDVDKGFTSKKKLQYPSIVCQTTISYEESEKFISKIQKKYKNAEVFSYPCKVCKDRQDKIINLNESFDLFLVVGSISSSNTDKLYKIAKDKFKEVYKVQDINALKELNLDLSKYETCAITSGTSSSMLDVVNIQEYLEHGKF